MAAALAAVVAIVVVTSSAVGTDDAGSELAVLDTGTPTTLSAGLLATLRTSGVEVAADDAVTVPAPDGVGAPWTIVQSTDGVCLVRRSEGGDPVNCGTTALLRRGAILGFTPDEEAAASLGLPDKLDADTRPGTIQSTGKREAAGRVSYNAIAANDVTAAAAVTADGRALASTKVENNVFVLADVPYAEVAGIRLSHAEGEDTVLPAGTR
ncbi:hypothetical protein [Conexibacter sp. CPCC 206217]|uniref:hypothetical protein n=1 Tax=Conexibacter sp. CPCC 206217 TaxID=3064574 RepID=UPI002726E706|nr:hypothetical protein [Conexibacter sp. CPCC 206217]MDO8212836.1 hypothetical protein [Conexibacter sp. CPCC 206217]